MFNIHYQHVNENVQVESKFRLNLYAAAARHQWMLNMCTCVLHMKRGPALVNLVMDI